MVASVGKPLSAESLLISVNSEIKFHEEEIDRFRVFNPFVLNNGDHLSIVLKKDENNQWILSDEGFIHNLCLNYFDEHSKVFFDRTKVNIKSTLEEFDLKDKNNELIFTVNDENKSYSVFKFAQGLITLSNLIHFHR